MINLKVLITDPIHEKGLKALKEKGFDVEYCPDIDKNTLIEKVVDVDVLIVRSRTKVTREVIDAAKKLKVIGRAGVGLDNIDVEYAQSKGIKIVNSAEAPSDSVAELTIGLMLSLLRRIPEADRSMKEGKWLKSELMGRQLAGKTVGIIGLGRIGKKVALILKAIGANVIAYDLYPDREFACAHGIEICEKLEDLLKRAEIITIHVPLTPETYHMIGEKEISMMKDGVYIINTSRGAVIDTEALTKALKEGKVAGVGLDVYEEEPPRDLEIIKFNNAVCTPHIGGSTIEAQEAISTILVDKIVKILEEM